MIQEHERRLGIELARLAEQSGGSGFVGQCPNVASR